MNYSVEKAFECLDIWENILKYFDVKEQLRLTKVCDLFHNVITLLLWKRTCKELKLYAINADKIIVTDMVDDVEEYFYHTGPMYKLGHKDHTIVNHSNGISVILDYDEVLEYLSFNLNYITKLQIIEEHNINLLQFLREKKLEKLTTLILCGVNELNNHLKDINVSCPQLNTLILKHCYNKQHEMKQGVLQDLNGITELSNMKMLKTLIICEKEFSYTLNHILKVIANLYHLSAIVLKVNFTTNDLDMSDEMNVLSQKGNLSQQLRIVIPDIQPQILGLKLLPHFQHLRELTVASSSGPLIINHQFSEILNTSCKHLKYLCLKYCYIKTLFVVPSLETLTLINCADLSWINLKSILSQSNLRSFTSFFSIFTDNFLYFYIQSPLEYLHIETLEYDFREDFANLLKYNSQQMKALKTLIWHDYTLWYADEPIAMILPLKDTYQSLHTLHIDLSVVDFVDILEMKGLKQLAFIENDNQLDLCSMLNILKHPSLESFTLYHRNLKCSIKTSKLNVLSFTTNLHLIQIPLDIFNRNQAIWFKLLSTNPRLHLVCYFYYENFIDFMYLKDLIENKNFPNRIKYIKLGDFTIDCNDLHKITDCVKTKISSAKHYCNQFKETMYLKF